MDTEQLKNSSLEILFRRGAWLKPGVQPYLERQQHELTYIGLIRIRIVVMSQVNDHPKQTYSRQVSYRGKGEEKGVAATELLAGVVSIKLLFMIKLIRGRRRTNQRVWEALNE